jgi:glycosyltransferase involved in cell wall biosynthesis
MRSELGNAWFRTWTGYRAAWSKSSVLSSFAGRMAMLPSRPNQLARVLLGIETVFSRHSWTLLDPASPDILHLHSLLGGYFDLRALPTLSQRVPTFVTLHDAWMFTGHCMHSFDCTRWQTGCGHCPYPDTFPAVKRDATAANWQRKRQIYERSRLYVSTPSRWLMDKVDQSMLTPAIVQRRVIPNGVDTDVFAPGDQQATRAALNLPRSANILLFTASNMRKNQFKDFATLKNAIERISSQVPDVLLIALGEDAPPERVGSAEIRFVPYQTDARRVADYYRAADLYLHSAREETFGLVIAEAQACGLPTVATAVGGIPEQIRHEETGLLVEPGNAAAFADAVIRLLSAPERRLQMRTAAPAHVRRHFTLRQQVEAMLSWYEEARQEHESHLVTERSRQQG